MDHEAFTKTVAEAAGIDPATAERAIEATLVTLGQRISEGEAEDLARREGRKEFNDMLSQLPRELRERLLAPAGVS
jgi:uncharacterized protein (DUF2267 family)